MCLPASILASAGLPRSLWSPLRRTVNEADGGALPAAGGPRGRCAPARRGSVKSLSDNRTVIGGRGQRLRGRGNKLRNDRWVFGDPASDAYLVKFSWTDIVRHVMVTGAASPDDPALADYWAERRRKVKPPLDNYTLRLLARQDARCPLRRDHLVSAGQPPQSPNDWEQCQTIATDYLVHHGRSDLPHNDPTRLVHASCRRGLRAR
jgi:hypothetical protein